MHLRVHQQTTAGCSFMLQLPLVLSAQCYCAMLQLWLRPRHLGRHVVGDAELQVVDDALHAVVGLLPGGAQVLLHGPCHGGKDGLGCLPGVHHLAWAFRRGRGWLVVLQALDVGKGFLYCHHQPGRRKCSMNGTVPWIQRMF